MIKRTFKFIYNLLVDIGEARHAQLKRTGTTMWY